MSGERITFDTNVFFYAVDPEEGVKNRRALEIFDAADPDRSFVVLQTLGELYYSVGRKRPALLEVARETVRDTQAFFRIVGPQSADLTEAILIQEQHLLPFWDAMLYATARRAGCTVLLTEDFQDKRTLGGVTFRNPFAMSAEELKELLS